MILGEGATELPAKAWGASFPEVDPGAFSRILEIRSGKVRWLQGGSPHGKAIAGIMKIRGTDFVMFQVADMPKAVRFYGETLGLPQEVDTESFAEFNCGNVTLSLLSGIEIPGGRAGGNIAFAVEDVQAAYEELKANGAALEGEPVDYGCCKAVTVQDPDGNVVILHRRADGTVGQESPEE